MIVKFTTIDKTTVYVVAQSVQAVLAVTDRDSKVPVVGACLLVLQGGVQLPILASPEAAIDLLFGSKQTHTHTHAAKPLIDPRNN